MTGFEAFLIARPDVVVFALVGLAIVVPLFFAQRRARLQWLEAVVGRATENVHTVDSENLTRLEYDKLRGKTLEWHDHAREELIKAMGAGIEMSDVWAFELRSPGGSSVTWFMRPETKEFLVPYTLINSSRQNVGIEYQRKLKELGLQAHIMHKMTHK